MKKSAFSEAAFHHPVERYPFPRGEPAVQYNYKLSRTPSYYILIFVLFRVLAVVGCGVGLTTNEEPRHKLLIFYQVSMCEFQREFRYGMEDKKWQYKYIGRFVGV